MNLAQLSIRYPLYPWLVMLTCLVGGLYGIDNVGRLEDPKFPVKQAFVITAYPGASAVETEQEVTDVVEAALQELPYVKHITSKSLPGRSEIEVEIQEKYDGAEVQQIWDELRRRVAEAAVRLPPTARTPIVEDDFGDVYGILYAVTATGYTEAEIHDMARSLESGLNSVAHVAKVQTRGVPAEALFVELEQERLVSLGLPTNELFAVIGTENQVMPPSSVAYAGRRLRLSHAQAYDSVAAVGDIRIGRPGSSDFVRLADVADISRGPTEEPFEIIRHQGARVFTVAVSIVDDENVVKVGKAVDRRMRELTNSLPIGVRVDPVYAQHKVVEDSLSAFQVNLSLSIFTVVAALCIFMGWRAGTVVGSILLLTVLGTLCLMALLGIELQRISLGALMIAMGMLVDNAIVIAEGMVTGVQRGLSAEDAASQSVERTQFPLLGATIIGIAAFGPIGLADDNAGHFLRSLFQVIAISLLLSWVLAVTVGPLLGSYLLKTKKAAHDTDLYDSWGYRPYKSLLGFSLRHAWFATFVLVAITASCLAGFGFVKQGFFPTTNSPLLFVDLRLPQGTDIQATAQEIRRLEPLLQADDEIKAITSFIGRGSTRFSATLRPEQPDTAYAQMVLRVGDITLINQTRDRLAHLLQNESVDAEVSVRRTEFTPSGSSKIEARFSGPDAPTLRALADQALARYLDHDLIDRKTDWRQRQISIAPRFDESRARQVGISRTDLAQAIAYTTTGLNIGVYRDADKLISIIARAPRAELSNLGALGDRQIFSTAQQAFVPVSQVISAIEVVAEDSLIHRRDRVRTIAALANPPVDHNVNKIFEEVRGDVEAIELPPGYRLEWGGEFEANLEANETLTSKIPMALGIMLLVTILMFGTLKQPLVIWLTVPMIICGVVVSLIATDLAFTFPSFLGFLSLSGMLIKNCIVLVDEIDKRLLEYDWTLETVACAAVSRLRPVLLAAGTTIAGMSPLLRDAFFLEMAVCIMGGLAFATLLTLIAAPVFYRIAMGKKLRPADQAEPAMA